MKKMICEVCGSQSIRKENNVFICQECGIEYSLEEVKKLLKEVDPDNSNDTVADTDKTAERDDLLASLKCWALLISRLPDVRRWIGFDCDITSEMFWVKTLPFVINNPSNLYHLRFKEDGTTTLISPSGYAHEKAHPGLKLYLGDELRENNLICREFYQKDTVLTKLIYDDIKYTPAHKEAIDFLKKNGSYLFYKNELLNDYVSLRVEEDNDEDILCSLYQNVRFETKDTMRMPLYQIKNRLFGRPTHVPADPVLQSTFDKIISLYGKTYRFFIRQHNKYIDHLCSFYPTIQEVYFSILEECESLEKRFFLPYKYRTTESILGLIDLLEDKKATTWKELVNLFDTHQYRAGVYERLDLLNSKLDVMQNSIDKGFSTVASYLENIQSAILIIDTKISLVNSSILAIRRYSFVTMWSSLS